MDDDIRQQVITHGRQLTLDLVSPTQPSQQSAVKQRRQAGKLTKLAADALSNELFGSDISYLYSGWTMVGLPHRRPTDEFQTWIRKNGRFSLMVEPGSFLDSKKMESTRVGLPYGSRARLILLFLQTEAIRQQSRVVELGGNLHQWLYRLGVDDSGANYTSVRDQARRLSACRLTVGWQTPDGAHGFERASLVSGMMFVPSEDARQGTLWTETARLSSEFYDSLISHPVPVTELAIRQLQTSSLSMDIYVWLAYRLRSLQKPTPISWAALHSQFGPDYSQLRHFKERFLVNLKEAVAVYPDAKLDIGTPGVVLHPSPPPVPEHALSTLGRFRAVK